MVQLQPSAQGLLACSIVWIIIDCVAVALRLLAKRKTGASNSLDDTWIFVALALVMVYNALQVRAIFAGGGSLDETDMTVPELTAYLKYLYIADVFWPPAITAVKLSILSLYRRIFFTRKFRYTSMIVDALCLVWGIICTFILVFNCAPVAAAWKVELQATATCQPLAALVLGPEFTNIVLDIVILCFPIHMIRQLKMPLRRKVLVTCVFVVGGLVCIVGILRMAILYNPSGNQQFSTKNAVVLDTIEIGTALVCACLPIYRPLLPKELPLTRHLTTWLSSIRSTWRLSRSRAKRSAGASPTSDSKPLRNNDDDKKGFHRFDGHSQEERHFASEVGGDKKGRNIVVGKGDYPMHEIEVQKTIDIV